MKPLAVRPYSRLTWQLPDCDRRWPGR